MGTEAPKPTCPHCGMPEGHTEDCPSIRPEGAMPPRRFETSHDPILKERLAVLRDVFGRFQEENPEALALGLYGSMVKGRAHEGSDIDTILFVEPSLAKRKRSSIKLGSLLPDDPNLKTFPQVGFDPKTQEEYESKLSEAILAEKSDLTLHILALPIDRRIIDQQLDVLTKADKPTDPGLNLVLMFTLQVGYGLNPYRNHLLNRLTELGNRGEQIWAQIVQGLESFEREAIDTGISYPRTLEEARRKYYK